MSSKNTTMWVIIAAVVVVAIVAAVLLTAQPGGSSHPTTTPTSTPTATASPSQPTTTSASTPTATTSPSPTTTSVPSQLSGSLTGGGSTFVAPQMFTWSKTFYQVTGGKIQVNYQSIGSGAGAAQFLGKNLDFGASDVPMPKDKYQQVAGQFVQFPVIIGSIVIAYNVPEIAYQKTGKYLNLTAEVIALIYMGNITQWCDPRIKALNPGLADKLPCKDIVAVHRSDGSGTTAAFTLYLSKAYPAWNQTVSWGYTVNWPADQKAKGTGAKGNEGVAQAVLQTPYSIGYIEFAYWATNKDKYDQVGGVAFVRNDNDGKYYFPTTENVAMGAAAGLERYIKKYGAPPAPDADWNPVSIEFSNPPRGYPIVSFTYVFLWKDYAAEGYGDAATKAALLKAFFRWVLTEGQKPENIVEGYIPLPSSIANIGLEALNMVKP